MAKTPSKNALIHVAHDKGKDTQITFKGKVYTKVYSSVTGSKRKRGIDERK